MYKELFRIKSTATTIEGIAKVLTSKTDCDYDTDEVEICIKQGFIEADGKNITVFYDG